VSKSTETTAVDLVIRLEVEGSKEAVAKRVQAEDGLWSLGQPEAEDSRGRPSEYVADIETVVVRSVLIDGEDRLTQKGGN